MWSNTGLTAENADILTAMQQLHRFIEEIPGLFKAFSEEELHSRPAPNKWSRQEILGHLVDSAINNLKRFTDIQVQPQPYQVIRYQQEGLVQVNDYQQLALEQVLLLWQLLNRQITHVVNRLPTAKRALVIIPPGGGDPKTLEWLIIDYVLHMEHHWRKVFNNP